VNLRSDAVPGVSAYQRALGLWTFLGILALPVTKWLCADMFAILKVLSAYQVARWLGANRVALDASIGLASLLGTNYGAIWLVWTFHATAFGIEAFAPRLANRCLALWSASLLTLWVGAGIMAQRVADFLWFRLRCTSRICCTRSRTTRSTTRWLTKLPLLMAICLVRALACELPVNA